MSDLMIKVNSLNKVNKSKQSFIKPTGHNYPHTIDMNINKPDSRCAKSVEGVSNVNITFQDVHETSTHRESRTD